MQSYPFQFTPTFSTKPFNCAGDLFVYESSVASGDNRISVMPAGGGEIILKPGQSFRITKQTDVWYVQAYDSASTITGNFNIGSGDFKDSATSTNQVTVVNNSSQPVTTAPVAAVSITNIAPSTIGTAAISVVNDAAYKRVIFRNAGVTGSIAIGGVGITFAGAAVVLEPGDIWVEDNAANLQWYAIASQAGCTLNMQGVK
jgi:hypothetical protein